MIYKSIFGDILLLVNNKNELYYCSLCDKNNMNKISDNKKIEENYIKQLDEYFNLKRKTFDVLIDLSHFNKYQQLVYKEVLKISYGETKSYQELAKKCFNNKKYARFVGNILSKNDVLFFIPCHRVIKSNGKISNYVLGENTKNKLLKLEKGVLK